MSRNLLDQETSPYLLQHKDNPVHWRPWGEAALAEAKTQNKPILLSVGYAACHWCHVMAHESFEDPSIAALMNDHFIPIKVDREERPDIDAIYQSALALIGEHGGWPLTMFLTPKAEPFWGGTYFPPQPRYGRPGFAQVLTALSDTFTNKPDNVAGNVEALRVGLAENARPSGGEALTNTALDIAAGSLLRMIDPKNGGTQGAPKFPQTGLFEMLWRGYCRRGEESMGRAVVLTLARICQGGIYDHLGGGFARYSTDAEWLVPHFEKMLYDNAGLMELLTLVWKQTGDPLYQRRVSETAGWLLREMMAEHNAFAASYDADSEHEEGKFYVWSKAEIEAALRPDLAALVCRVYGVTDEGNWEDHNILHRNHPGGKLEDAEEIALDGARLTLLELRAKRVWPGRDDKVLADWNGMMIAALAKAAFAFERADWLAAAHTAFEAVVSHMTRLEPNRELRLHHSLRLGRLQPDAMLDDYAQMTRAALALYETTGETTFLHKAEALMKSAHRHYHDPAGGYFFTADDAPTLIVRTKSALDHAHPSGNAAMAENWARLFHITGDDTYRQRAETTVTAFTGEIGRQFPSMGALLNAWELLTNAVRVTIIGADGDADRAALLRVAAASGDPNLVIVHLAPGAVLPKGYPPVKPGPATAIVCRGQSCSLPLMTPEALQRALSGE
ncbi:MAG TPA: thioredoxin domain-containing protein [Magnetospirillaceae bacterium]